MEKPNDTNEAPPRSGETPEQLPQTAPGSPEREAAIREWSRHEGTRVLLQWVRLALRDRRQWLEDAMHRVRDQSEDVLLNEQARARAIEYRAEATVFDTVEMLLVGKITRAGAAPDLQVSVGDQRLPGGLDAGGLPMNATDLLGAVAAEATERCGRSLNADPFVWQVFSRLLTAAIKARDAEARAEVVAWLRLMSPLHKPADLAEKLARDDWRVAFGAATPAVVPACGIPCDYRCGGPCSRPPGHKSQAHQCINHADMPAVVPAETPACKAWCGMTMAAALKVAKDQNIDGGAVRNFKSLPRAVGASIMFCTVACRLRFMGWSGDPPNPPAPAVTPVPEWPPCPYGIPPKHHDQCTKCWLWRESDAGKLFMARKRIAALETECSGLRAPATPPTPSAPPAPPFCNCDLGTAADDWKHRKDCTRYGWDEAQDEIESTAPSAPPREGMAPGDNGAREALDDAGPVVPGHTTMCPANAAGPCICKRGGRR
jgi:hypothetical protein